MRYKVSRREKSEDGKGLKRVKLGDIMKKK